MMESKMTRIEKLRRQSELLEESIQDKWIPLSSGNFTENKEPDCALCGEYWVPGDDIRCSGCPIREDTGAGFCDKTPYAKWGEVFREGWNEPETVVYASMELQYLRDLKKRVDEKLSCEIAREEFLAKHDKLTCQFCRKETVLHHGMLCENCGEIIISRKERRFSSAIPIAAMILMFWIAAGVGMIIGTHC